MPETDIGSAKKAAIADVIVDYSVDPQSTDAAGDQKEFSWQTTTWNQNLGYYKTIPELKSAIDAKATWTIGAGIEADEPTTLLLMSIKGNGKDSFTSILKNQIKVSTIDGDSYAEIIRDEDEVLVNLKPLAPDSIVSYQNAQGRFTKYEQVSKIKGTPNKIFQPEEIFHLSRERLADEIHGVGVIAAVEWIIKARNEAMNDWKTVLHRNVYPIWIYHLDTDDPTEIAAIKVKVDKSRATGENIYVPKDIIVPEQANTAINATLNPITWINQLNDYFFQAVNVPQIIMGGSKEFTEASGKIVYLSYEQSVKAEQLYVEEQVLAQLNLEIALTFPASLQSELISDTNAEPAAPEVEAPEPASEPNDESVEMEGKN